MGLDIYLFEVEKTSEKTHSCEGANEADFKKYFPDALIEVENEYIDIEASLKKKGKNYLEYDWVMSGPNGILFKPIEGSAETEEVLLKDEDCIPIMVKELEIPVVEVAYQRKGMESGFSSVAPEEKSEDGTLTIFAKTDIEKLFHFVSEHQKPYFKKNIVDVFEEGKHILWFWW